MKSPGLRLCGCDTGDPCAGCVQVLEVRWPAPCVGRIGHASAPSQRPRREAERRRPGGAGGQRDAQARAVTQLRFPRSCEPLPTRSLPVRGAARSSRPGCRPWGPASSRPPPGRPERPRSLSRGQDGGRRLGNEELLKIVRTTARDARASRLQERRVLGLEQVTQE